MIDDLILQSWMLFVNMSLIVEVVLSIVVDRAFVDK
jgi:hypothetical protein